MTLTSSDEIPLVGLGCWKIPNEQCEESVFQAIKMGYRMLDSACDYANEVFVGKGIAKAINQNIIERKDLFVTSKLWNSFHRKENVKIGLEKTLKDLDLEYLDLYLIHFPIPSAFVDPNVRYPPEWSIDGKSMDVSYDPVSIQETWAAMENLVTLGLVKNIGVANFNCNLIRQLLVNAKIKPYVNQVELHPYLSQQKLRTFCQSNGIRFTAFSSFGTLSYIPLGFQSAIDSPSLLELDVVLSIAKANKKTPAQVLLRWSTQREVSVIPKSLDLGRMKENLDSLGFDLKNEEMDLLDGLNRNLRFNDPGVFANFPIWD